MRTIIIPGVIGGPTDPSCEDGPTEQGGVETYAKNQNLQSDWIWQMQEISASLLFMGENELQRGKKYAQGHTWNLNPDLDHTIPISCK